MKFQLNLCKDRHEEVIVYAHQKSKLTEELEQLVTGYSIELNGYIDKEVIRLNATDVFCFVVENNKVYAIMAKNKLQLKRRLYQLEEILQDNFIKINKSCIVNIKKIERFDASLAGALNVRLKNGYSDYVSRRNLKAVKERLGL